MKKRLLKVILQISILILCLFGYYFFNRHYSISIPCVFYQITGLKCPGCGITRCLFSLVEGDWRKAFQYNGLVVLMGIPFLMFQVLNCYRYICGKSIIRVSDWVCKFLLVLVLLFGIVRNIV